MKYLIFFAMSLLSLLFGCNPKKTPAKSEEYPRFPATDNPAAKVIPVNLDDGFRVKSFFIAEDKQNLYVLGYRKLASTLKEGEEPRPDERDLADFRLYNLDNDGQVKHRLNLPRTDVYAGGNFALLDGQLMLWTNYEMLVLDEQKFVIQEKIPVYDVNSFLPKAKIELMTPDEREEAYQKKFDAIIEEPASCRWLEWSPGSSGLVFVQNPVSQRSAWAPLSSEDDVLVDLKSRFTAMIGYRNPNAENYQNGENFRCTDGAVQIREAEYLSGGTQLDYPNYKTRTILQYEMVVGSKTLHFSTTDKSRHDLRLSFSDNLMLSTSNGCAWVGYEGVLYRVE